MRYNPYGEVLSRSGSISDRFYQWVATYGYRATFNYASSHYMRARHYLQTTGVLTTVDPLWPDESAYRYVGGRAIRSVDPSGLGDVETGCADFEKARKQRKEVNACVEAALKSRGGKPACKQVGDKPFKCLKKRCKNHPKPTIDPPSCCKTKENSDPPRADIECEKNTMLLCKGTKSCSDGYGQYIKPVWQFAIMNELMHCCGFDQADDQVASCHSIAACCMLKVVNGQRDYKSFGFPEVSK